MQETILHMKIDPQLKIRLRELAELDNRTLSNLIQKILMDWLKAAEREGARADARTDANLR